MPFDHIRNPQAALAKASLLVNGHCGCSGFILPGCGCVAYLDSEERWQDCNQQAMMRSGGLGFGTDLPIDKACMSMHLQAHGLSFEKTVDVLFPAPNRL